jgi:predicted acylesterase/phospholipase RssA
MNKFELFEALESQIEAIEVKALRVTLHFRALTGTARDAFNAAITAGDKTNSHFEAALVAATVVEEDGLPMFSADDIDTLRAKNAKALTALAEVAMRVNMIGAEAEQEAVKN